jgi:hypothetical protein
VLLFDLMRHSRSKSLNRAAAAPRKNPLETIDEPDASTPFNVWYDLLRRRSIVGAISATGRLLRRVVMEIDFVILNYQ